MKARRMEHKDALWRPLDEEFFASMVKASAAWNRRWPILDVTVEAAEPDIDEEDDTAMDEPDEETPEDVPEEEPDEVSDGTTRDREPCGGYHYNSFL